MSNKLIEQSEIDSIIGWMVKTPFNMHEGNNGEQILIWPMTDLFSVHTSVFNTGTRHDEYGVFEAKELRVLSEFGGNRGIICSTPLPTYMLVASEHWETLVEQVSAKLKEKVELRRLEDYARVVAFSEVAKSKLDNGL